MAPSSEYTKLLTSLKDDKMTKGDVYTELVKKESNVLSTVNRMIDHEQQKKIDTTLFYNMSLLSMVAVFANTWKNIFLELAIQKSFRDIPGLLDIFTKNDRKIYVGLMIALIGLSLFFVDISS